MEKRENPLMLETNAATEYLFSTAQSSTPKKLWERSTQELPKKTKRQALITKSKNQKSNKFYPLALLGLFSYF
ncbi:MAG: hypothetical protein AAF215_29045 [Cyanobacteria bacterium P01_A01_bin.123]